MTKNTLSLRGIIYKIIERLPSNTMCCVNSNISKSKVMIYNKNKY